MKNEKETFFFEVGEKQVLAAERARQLEAVRGNIETAHLISISWLPKTLSICFSAYPGAPKRRYVQLTKTELFMSNEEWAVHVQSVAQMTIKTIQKTLENITEKNNDIHTGN